MKLSGFLAFFLLVPGFAVAQEELSDADKQLIQAIQAAGGQGGRTAAAWTTFCWMSRILEVLGLAKTTWFSA